MPHHYAGRILANRNMLQPGPAEFDATLDAITSTSAKLTDNTKTQSFEVNYDLTDRVDFADIIIGGSYRNSDLNTSGSVLTSIMMVQFPIINMVCIRKQKRILEN